MKFSELSIADLVAVVNALTSNGTMEVKTSENLQLLSSIQLELKDRLISLYVDNFHRSSWQKIKKML